MSLERKIIATYGSGRTFKTAKEAMEHVTPFDGKVIDHTDTGGILRQYRVARSEARTGRDR